MPTPSVPTPAQAAPQAFPADNTGAPGTPAPPAVTVAPSGGPTVTIKASPTLPVPGSSKSINLSSPWVLALGACALAAGGACGYHGYKRNDGNAAWGMLWGLSGVLFPPMFLQAVADGYAEPSDTVRLKHLEQALKLHAPETAKAFVYGALGEERGLLGGVSEAGKFGVFHWSSNLGGWYHTGDSYDTFELAAKAARDREKWSEWMTSQPRYMAKALGEERGLLGGLSRADKSLVRGEWYGGKADPRVAILRALVEGGTTVDERDIAYHANVTSEEVRQVLSAAAVKPYVRRRKSYGVWAYELTPAGVQAAEQAGAKNASALFGDLYWPEPA